MARATGIHRTARGGALATYAAVLAFTVILSAGAVLLGYRVATAPEPPPDALDARSTLPAQSPATAPASAATGGAAAGVPTRLQIVPPNTIMDSGIPLPAGIEVNVPLPNLPDDVRAVLVEVTLRDAGAPGIVTLRTTVEETAALRLAAPKAMSSATVVALVDGDRALAVRTQGGGRLNVTLVGIFRPADTATAGRVVTLPASPVLTLTPAKQGNDAIIDVARIPALRSAGSMSAVMLNLDGDVGTHGGFVAMGPSGGALRQQVHWSPTQGADRTRHGFLVVPVAAGQLHLQYHAGTQLRVEIAGYVTGDGAAQSADGLVVPVPASGAQSVRVAPGGQAAVPVIPPGGTSLVPSERVSAALVGVLATAQAVGGVAVRTPGAVPAGGAGLQAAAKPRSMLALSGVENGTVSVSSQTGATVVVTPRALVLKG
jgi:hypothetical protein